MKKNVLKLAQKGGMMIEALAMLGLIAVVTPTMYKKSAERTLEVEDINTATSMRSVMSAADSYVSSHYGELVQEMTADNATTKPLDLETDLQPYLPYGFNPNRLYDFEAPKVSVARNGNNLTAFVLFPAKEDGENGLGQERTVRIATLIGANGGYVNGDHTAKGIGGIWNLDNDDDSNVRFSNLFAGQNPNIYSIVTASSDAINNTNTEEDTDKFLYRTDGNGRWHNTMRADLYMGGDIENDNNDGYKRNSDFFSIRRVKSLIIGADGDVDNYGLYISEDADNPDAYIYGTLKAAEEQFSVDTEKLVYKSTNDNEIGMKIEGNNIYFGAQYPGQNYDSDSDLGGVVHSINYKGDIENYGVDIHLAKSWGLDDSGEFTVGDLSEPVISATDNAEGRKRIQLMSNNTFVIDNQHDSPSNDNVIMMMNNTVAGYGKGDSTSWNKAVSYNANPSPIFPIRIGSNAIVNGILAAAQLDTQNIRAAELEVGSEKIDDEMKWLKVDAHGIHGSYASDDKKYEAMLEVHKNFAAIGVGDEALANNEISGKKNVLFMGRNDGISMTSTQSIGIYVPSAESSAPTININTDTIQQQLKNNDVIFSSKEAANTESTNVKIQQTNFEVRNNEGAGENGKIVFAVKGNANPNDDKLKNNNYDVAVHGSTVFTPSDSSNPYLTVGEEFAGGADNTGVAISKASDDGISNAMYVDVGSDAVTRNRPGNEVKDENQWNMDDTYYAPGTVYVRKGLVEVLPDVPTDKAETALSGKGVVAAGRFVANNLDDDGDEVKVPQFFTGTDYTGYNDDSSIRYDTYMVNPAYTSVMHDIKLTTRGGARLSDILPDFINKGIYITSNTYKDNITSLTFALDGGVVKPVGGATPLSGPITLGDEDSWASPYLGFIPAPQCPPGYNRVITMSPQSFMMSQAGQMQRGEHASKQYKDKDNHWQDGVYYTKNQVPNKTAFTAYEQAGINDNPYIQQGFQQVAFEDDVDLVDTNGNVKQVVTAKNGDPQTVKAKTSALNLRAIDSGGNVVSSGNPYFLLSYGDTTPPLTIQQSTWLKTNVVPVDNTGNSYSIGDTNSGYTIGWAAIMGFVYDYATYKSVINQLSGNIQYNSGNTNVYWNVFPVRRNTLEAYATTYCYFDRNNIAGWDATGDYTGNQYIDHYNALRDYGSYTKKKHSNESYKKRLNDPTLKYDEVW